MSKPGSTTVIEAHSVHRDIRGEHPSFVFTHAGDIAFALRTSLAGLAALYAALWLELDTPQWAIWTVFIVSPPVRGNALRKTVARLVGTVVGSIAAIVFVGVFPQQPAGFYILLAAWLGTCAYWGTLRRGYVSYAATLAAFTSAIVSAGVSVNPLSVWQTASDRTAATVIGVLFALLASDIAARGDDAPGELAKRVRGLAADLLDWAAGQLQLGKSDEAMDAPLTAKILALDETCINAIAERPALIRVRSWIGGIPTALLSLQSAVLCLRDSSRRGGAATPDARPETDAIDGVAVFLRSESAVDLPSLRRQRASLAAFRQAPWAPAAAVNEIGDALVYLLASLEAILTLHPPPTPPPLYPKPTFVAHRNYAIINLIRSFVGVFAGFLVWDATAWSHGTVFMVYIAVALVIFVNLEDPLIANLASIIGTSIGCIVALAAKYVFLVRDNTPLNLLVVLFPLVFIGAWIQTKGKLAPLGLFFVIAILAIIAPTNPQEYNFVKDVNTFIALECGFGFVSLVFRAIGAPREGQERIIELFGRMRNHRQHARVFSSRQDRLSWETWMYDELQRLQAVTKDPRHRRFGVNLLLSGLKGRQAFASAPAGLEGN